MSLLGLIPVLGEIIEKVIPDPNKRAELNLELAKLADSEAQREHEQMLGQIEVNKVEAGHRSLFIAGWRPAMGWIGASAMATVYVLQPLYQLLTGVAVTLDTSELMVLIGGMLGFGGLRSFDKMKGTSNDTPLVVRNVPAADEPVKPAKKRILPFSIPGL